MLEFGHAAGALTTVELAPSASTVTLSGPRHQVKRMIVQGVPFGDLEEYIDTLSLSAEEQSALWLFAWTLTTNRALRKQVEFEAHAPRLPELA